MTALNGCLLIAVVALLTWRAHDAQRQLTRIIVVDSRALTDLTDFARNHVAFQNQWNALSLSAPDQLPSLVQRYRASSAVLGSTALKNSVDAGSLRQRVDALIATAADSASSWSSLTPDGQIESQQRLYVLSDEINRTLNAAVSRKKSDIEQKVPVIADEGDKTKLMGFAIAWIVMVLSLAVARLTVARVVQPLELLSAAARKLEDGDRSARAPIAGDFEVAQLGESFNSMARAVEESGAQLSLRARTDELTQMPNFRAFREKIDEEIERASRYTHAFGLLVFDLDRFKKYNDQYGHLAGNQALQTVAVAIRHSMRAVDSPARYGGEEFAAVLPQIDEAGLALTAERIRAGVESIEPIEGRSRITMSIGGAMYPEDGLTAEELFKAADARLYEAKEGGRNRAVTPGAVATPKRKSRAAK
ncbi:MAG TPA: GGDEF domain-containing protein [Thermoanaerobaculia bacterium]|nr:GGDEF domain-containing protein [Thermoanaerobaculia bacterium]